MVYLNIYDIGVKMCAVHWVNAAVFAPLSPAPAGYSAPQWMWVIKCICQGRRGSRADTQSAAERADAVCDRPASSMTSQCSCAKGS